MSRPVALVTNARSFLGPPAVAALREAQFRVLAHDPAFSDGAAREDYESSHPGVTCIDAREPQALAGLAWQAAGRLDVLVSNDSHPAVHAPVDEAHVSDLRETLERLVVFPFALAKAAIPRLKAQGHGRIVFITSCRTSLPMPGGAIPDAARAGANALVKSLGIELAPHGIPVNAVAPNFVESETYFPRERFVDDAAGGAFVRASVPAGRLGLPAEAGELIRQLATMEGTFMTGAVIDLAGGWPAAPARPA